LVAARFRLADFPVGQFNVCHELPSIPKLILTDVVNQVIADGSDTPQRPHTIGVKKLLHFRDTVMKGRLPRSAEFTRESEGDSLRLDNDKFDIGHGCAPEK
jgi:hypothetical protein